jgi:hypothetical protein
VIVRCQVGTVWWSGMDRCYLLPVWIYLQGLQRLLLSVPVSVASAWYNRKDLDVKDSPLKRKGGDEWSTRVVQGVVAHWHFV